MLMPGLSAAESLTESAVQPGSAIDPFNGGFEEPVVDDTIPGWTFWGLGGSDSFSVVDTRAAEGEFSLLLDDPSSEIGAGLRSDVFAITGGETYQVSAQVYVEQYTRPATAGLYLYFYDDSGQQLAQHTTSLGSLPHDSWQPVALEANAPAEATSAAVMWYSSVTNIATYYADDVRVLPVEPTPEPEITNLGPGILSTNVRNVVYDQLPDGRAVAYATSNGTPATFNVVDVRTGERLFATSLEGYTLGGWMDVAPDGTVYFTAREPTPAGLFRFHPDTFELEHLADRVAGERVLYSGTFAADGKVYFGTYPNAKVVSFDPATDTVHDYGSMTDDAAYVFSVGAVGDKVWAGTGPVPHLYEIDPATGDTTELDVPERLLDNVAWYIAIEERDDLVFVRLSPRGGFDLAAYDRKRDRWLDDVIESTSSAAPTTVDHRGRVYMMAGGKLIGYHLQAKRIFSTGFEDTELPQALADAVGTYGIALMNLDEMSPKADTVVGLSTDGDLWHYHLRTRQAEVIPADVLGAPGQVHSIGVAPDGAVYFGAYLSSGAMSRINQTTGEIEQLRGAKQADKIISHNDEIVVASYPDAVVHAGNASEPWEWGANPRRILSIGRGEPHYQDRIPAITSIGDRIALGTVPDYGELGGVLALADTATQEYEVHRDVVPDQSVISLAYRDGLIYGGTSIHGGLSSTPTQGEAELFIWDVAAGERVWNEPVVDGAELIHQLAFDADGMLWGMAGNGRVFEFDPANRSVTRTFDTGLITTLWGFRTALHLDEESGRFYGNAEGRLFRFDPASLHFEILADRDVRYSARDGNGNLYFADATYVYRYDE
jgi:streptogramin lyase